MPSPNRRSWFWPLVSAATLSCFIPGACFEGLVAKEIREHGAPVVPPPLDPRIHQFFWIAEWERSEDIQCQWFGTLPHEMLTFSVDRKWRRRRHRPQPGRAASNAAAQLWAVSQQPMRTGHWHLANLAASTWFSCHTDARGLTAYLAEFSYFGRGAWGLRSAAMRYYASTPEALSDARLATVLAAHHQPSYGCQPEKLQRARDALLRRLAEANALTNAKLSAAVNEPLGLTACVERRSWRR